MGWGQLIILKITGNIKESLVTIRWMELEDITGKMEPSSKESLQMTKELTMEKLSWPMEKSFNVNKTN